MGLVCSILLTLLVAGFLGGVYVWGRDYVCPRPLSLDQNVVETWHLVQWLCTKAAFEKNIWFSCQIPIILLKSAIFVQKLLIYIPFLKSHNARWKETFSILLSDSQSRKKQLLAGCSAKACQICQKYLFQFRCTITNYDIINQNVGTCRFLL